MNNKPVAGIQRIIRSETHAVEVGYWNIESSENFDKLHAIVERCSFLFPSWLKELSISLYNHPAEGQKASDAACRPEKWEYGRAELDIFAAFWDRTEQYQHEVIVHELVHVMQGKQLSVVRNDILPRVEEHNKELGEHLERQFREINEEFVEAMTGVIGRML